MGVTSTQKRVSSVLSLDRFAVESDVLGIRVRQAGSTVTVASKPLVITIVLLAVPSRGDIGVDIRAVS
jgi:hypothetical protein